MRHKRIQNVESQAKPADMPGNDDQQISFAIVQLIVKCYVHGAQTCKLHDGTVLGMSITKGAADELHLFIDEAHKISIKIHNGMSCISDMENKELSHLPYIIHFAKTLGLPEDQTLQKFSEM